ncbi:MAG: hypothetical protein ACKO2K_12710, partial [Alphaproteobacteria bacterium]
MPSRENEGQASGSPAPAAGRQDSPPEPRRGAGRAARRIGRGFLAVLLSLLVAWAALEVAFRLA